MWSSEPCIGLAACRVKEDLNIVPGPGNRNHSIMKLLCSAPRGGGRRGGMGVLPMMAFTGWLCLFKLQVYERVRILLVDVYKRVGKSVILVCKRANR